MDGALAELPASEADQAIGSPIKIAVEHPDRPITAGDVLLQHEIGPVEVFSSIVEFQKFFFGLNDEHLLSRPVPQPLPINPLEHDGKAGPFPEKQYVRTRSREDGVGCWNTVPAGEVEHVTLAGEGTDEAGLLLRKNEALRKRFGMVRDKVGRSIGGWNQDAGPSDPPMNLCHVRQGLICWAMLDVPHKSAPTISGTKRGRPGVRVDVVNGYAKPAEAPHDVQAAVAVGPEYDDRRGRISEFQHWLYV